MAEALKLSHSERDAAWCFAPRCVAGPLAKLTSGFSARLGPFVNVTAAHAYHVTAPTPQAPHCNSHVVAHVQVVQLPTVLLLAGAMHVGFRRPRCRDGCIFQLHSSSAALPVLHTTDAMSVEVIEQHLLDTPVRCLLLSWHPARTIQLPSQVWAAKI